MSFIRRAGRKNGISLLPACLCLVISISLLLASGLPRAGIALHGESAKAPNFFINNEPWADADIYGWVKISSVYYVPIDCFTALEGVEIVTNLAPNVMTINCGEKYLSIDTKTKNFAFTAEDGEFYMKTYLLKSNMLWVPAKYIADYFGFLFEVTDGGEALRMRDATAKKSFNDVLLVYNPDLAVKPATETVTSADTETVTTAEVIGDRLIYLTFEDAPTERTGELLDLLSKRGVKATFFVRGDLLRERPELVRRMLVEGHAVGLHCMTYDEEAFEEDFSGFLGELHLENELLYKLFKLKTRIVRAPNGSSTDEFFIDEERGAELAEAGYVVWDWNVYGGDDVYKTAKRVSDAVIAGIKKYDIPVVRLHSGERALAALPEILDFIAGHRQFKTSVITPSAYEVNFIGVEF